MEFVFFLKTLIFGNLFSFLMKIQTHENISPKYIPKNFLGSAEIVIGKPC